MLSIVDRIHKICKKNNILYKSPNYKELKQSRLDAQSLAKIYTDLKIISGDLEIIKEKIS